MIPNFNATIFPGNCLIRKFGIMKHLVKVGIFAFFFLFFTACAEDEPKDQVSYIIEFGSECGWCAGQEYITVSNSKVEYLRNIPCGENQGATNKSRNLNSDEWEALKSSFDYSLFVTLEYNECNVCVDGCDEIIRITEGEKSHELRYSFSDEVEGMEMFRQKLTDLMEEMREQN